jgi:hypothetical protein
MLRLQFIGYLSGGDQFDRAALAVGGEKGLWRLTHVAFHRGRFSGDHRTCTAWFTARASAMTRGARRWQHDGGENSIRKISAQGRGTAASRSGAQLTDGEALSLCNVIYLPPARIQTPATRIAAEVSSAVRVPRGNLIQSRLLYHCEFQSDEPDSQCWTRISSKFPVVTDLSLYTKVIDL